MMKMLEGKFNTDATALQQRIKAHEMYGSYDLNQWIFNLLEVTKGISILDLGCGTGKQALPLARMVGDKGQVVAVDISSEALDALKQSAREIGVDKQVITLHAGLDDIGKYANRQFDRVLASYSLYYANNPEKVLEGLRDILKTGGILFFCGPAKDNNIELKRFHYALWPKAPAEDSTGASIFIEDTGLRLARKFFGEVRVFNFENPLQFDSPQALYDYWSSYNLYDQSVADKFKTAASAYFDKNPIFKTVKRVHGIRAIK